MFNRLLDLVGYRKKQNIDDLLKYIGEDNSRPSTIQSKTPKQKMPKKNKYQKTDGDKQTSASRTSNDSSTHRPSDSGEQQERKRTESFVDLKTKDTPVDGGPKDSHEDEWQEVSRRKEKSKAKSSTEQQVPAKMSSNSKPKKPQQSGARNISTPKTSAASKPGVKIKLSTTTQPSPLSTSSKPTRPAKAIQKPSVRVTPISSTIAPSCPTSQPASRTVAGQSTDHPNSRPVIGISYSDHVKKQLPGLGTDRIPNAKRHFTAAEVAKRKPPTGGENAVKESAVPGKDESRLSAENNTSQVQPSVESIDVPDTEDGFERVKLRKARGRGKGDDVHLPQPVPLSENIYEKLRGRRPGKTMINKHAGKDQPRSAPGSAISQRSSTNQHATSAKLKPLKSSKKKVSSRQENAEWANANRQQISRPTENKLKPDISSQLIYKDVCTQCTFILTCKDCIKDKIDQKKYIAHPECSGDKLMGRLFMEDFYTPVRQCPRFHEPKALCEYAYKECPKKTVCTYPHNETERILWDSCAENRSSVAKFQEHFRILSLRKTIDDIVHKEFELDVVCKKCWNTDDKSDCSKIKHKPLCKQGHSMKESNTGLVLRCKKNPGNLVAINLNNSSLPANEDLVSAAEQLRNLLQISYTKGEVTNQYNSVSQRFKSQKESEKKSQQRIYTRIDAEFMPSTTEKWKHSRKVIYDDEFDDILTDSDIDSEEEISDDDFIDGESRKRRFSYSLLPIKECRELLEDQPDMYKLCRITLEGSQDATCVAVDDNNSRIKIHGRHNCGTAFDGDEVIVEIMKWEDPETKKIHVGGRVKCVTKQCTNREAYVFVCIVDEFTSRLMIPLCGKAPKIHIFNKGVVEHNKKDINFNNQLVNICEKDARGRIVPKPDRETPISAKAKADKLFIVKFDKWNNNQRYPFGYVTKVVRAGDNLERGSLVLRLMYQVPMKSPELKADSDLTHQRKIEELSKEKDRLDLTDLTVFSIDPENCRDVDDALSVEIVQNGGEDLYKVGIHIADVSAIVTRHSAVDTLAAKRRTSYYPLETEKTVHMLPENLSTNFCSLLEGQNRLAISCFVTMDKNGMLKSKPIFHESVIRNRKQFSYKEANAVILDGNEEESEFSSEMKTLFLLALRLRTRRTGSPAVNSNKVNNLRFTSEHVCDEESRLIDACHAHILVEEFMLLINTIVAQRIYEEEQELCVVRKQLQPNNDDFNTYVDNHGNLLDSYLFMRPYLNWVKKNKKSGDQGDETQLKDDYIALSQLIVPFLKNALETKDPVRMLEMLSNQELIPTAYVGQVDWYRIQSNAEIAVVEKSKITGHFALQRPLYSWFSSPIRRYIDIVNHRILKAIIKKETMPYCRNELVEIAGKFNRTNQRQKTFSKGILRMKVLNFLKESPIYIPCPISSIDDESVNCVIPFLPRIKSSESKMHYGKLMLAGKPIEKGKGQVLPWERRLYEMDKKCINYARPKKDTTRGLQPKWHTVDVSKSDWKKLMTFAFSDQRSQPENVQTAVKEVLDSVHFSKNVEVTSEMEGNVPIVKHQAKFRVHWSPGNVIQLQIGAMCKEGMLQASINRICLTKKLHHCYEHLHNPITCFAEVAEKKSKKFYRDLKEYQETWLPILNMEAITCAAKDSDPIMIHDVPITVWKLNDEYFGHMEFRRNYLRDRSILFITHDSDDEENSQDYLCLRIPLKPSSHYLPPGNQSLKPFINWTNQWTAHALITEVHRESEDKEKDGEDESDTTDVRTKSTKEHGKRSSQEDEKVKVSFKLHHFNAGMTQQMLDESGTTTDNGTLELTEVGTIELFSKSLPDRRMFNAVMALKESTEFCQEIVLGYVLNHKKMIMEDEWLELIPEPGPTALDIDVQEAVDRQGRFLELYPNNKAQNKAIRDALRRRFTVIQGPPGTGKTLTGIKLLYWFANLNKELEKKDGFKRQVMYCGPSNSAVDVATKLLKYRLAEKCPKMVRVFSEYIHKQHFPIPRYYTSSSKERQYDGLTSNEMHELALHYKIRDNKNQGALAAEIRNYDERFKRIPAEKITDAEIAAYKDLVKKVSINELSKYDVILCTCSVSAKPTIQRGCNITQIVIDECGMCMEPETLVPLISLSPQPKQVVLIGDHKQLRPIVINETASELGLDKSLFERYATMQAGLIMLNEQYRMNRKICDFPSKHFYDDRLITHLTNYWYADGEVATEVWPNKAPFVFCHVEGAEESLQIATPEGSEQSKWNKADAAQAIRIFLEFTGTLDVNYKRIVILSQYKAQMKYIEKELKEYGYKHPNVRTVVSSQGDEWDYVILSTVRSLPPYEIDNCPTPGWIKKNLGFITDHNQINVAITRARKGLVIIGNKDLLRCDNDPKTGLWCRLLDFYEKKGCLVEADKFPRRHDELKFRTHKMDTYRPLHKGPIANPDKKAIKKKGIKVEEWVPPRYAGKTFKRDY